MNIYKKQTKYILIGLTLWIVLQIPRLIAIPIINDVLRGVDDGAWLYPAILDIVVAALSPLAIFLLWKKPNVSTWAFLLIYFVISIVDHGDAVTAASVARIPQTFVKMGVQNAGNTPIIQSIVDIVCIILICMPLMKKYFFNLNNLNGANSKFKLQ